VNAPAEVLPQHELEPVEGWRAWELRRGLDGLTLISPLVEMHWPAGRRLSAACRRHGGHRAPDEDCSCGIYAVPAPEALGAVRTGVSVVGSVALWGRVVEHVRGYRGEFAYPQRLRLVCAPCLERSGTFTAPSEVVSDADRLRPLCAFHAWSVQPLAEGMRVRPAGEVEAELLSTYQIELLPLERIPRHAAQETRVRRRGRRRFRIAREGELAAFARAAMLWALIVAVIGGAGRSVTERPVAPSVAPSRPAVAADSPFGMHPEREMWSTKPAAPALGLEILCGRGSQRMVVVVGCRAPGVGWMSVGTVRSGSSGRCPDPAIAVASSDGRTRCWVRLDSPS
jgi:hypothetical protein